MSLVEKTYLRAKCDGGCDEFGPYEFELDDLLETIEKIKARPNPNLQLLGVVITMHDKRTTLARDIHEQIGQVFGDRLFNTIITKSIRLEESPAYKESIFTFAPRSSGAMEYYSLSEEVLSRV